MLLLDSLQRKDFPLSLYRHPARQLLVYAVRLLNRRVDAGSITRLIKVKSHRAEPLNNAADARASAAAEMDPTRPADLDPEAVYFYFHGTPVMWDTRLRRTWCRELPCMARRPCSDQQPLGHCHSQPPGCCGRCEAGARWGRCYMPFSPAQRNGASFRQ